MPAAVLTDLFPMPKKPGPEKPPPHETFGRIELQASPEWIDQLDATAKAMGLSRSAYIRQACNRQMAEDRKVIEGNRQ